MDYTPMASQLFKLWWLAPLSLLIGLLKTPWFKGVLGEAKIKFAARLLLPADVYHRIHNITLPTPDGTTQIDHVFVSPFGVFVVETKNMSGWIFGGERQAQWTQKIFKRTFRFQNPLRQNYKHIKALEAALDLPPDVIHSVVVFAGDSDFKTPMPPNVTQGVGYIRYIKSFQDPVLSDAQVQTAASQLHAGRLAPTRDTHYKHVQQLRTRSDPTAARTCPKCGSVMVLRTARRGADAGKQFWGCSAYPTCKVTQQLFTRT